MHLGRDDTLERVPRESTIISPLELARMLEYFKKPRSAKEELCPTVLQARELCLSEVHCRTIACALRQATYVREHVATPLAPTPEAGAKCRRFQYLVSYVYSSSCYAPPTFLHAEVNPERFGLCAGVGAAGRSRKVQWSVSSLQRQRPRKGYNSLSLPGSSLAYSGQPEAS